MQLDKISFYKGNGQISSSQKWNERSTAKNHPRIGQQLRAKTSRGPRGIVASTVSSGSDSRPGSYTNSVGRGRGTVLKSRPVGMNPENRDKICDEDTGNPFQFNRDASCEDALYDAVDELCSASKNVSADDVEELSESLGKLNPVPLD